MVKKLSPGQFLKTRLFFGLSRKINRGKSTPASKQVVFPHILNSIGTVESPKNGHLSKKEKKIVIQ